MRASRDMLANGELSNDSQQEIMKILNDRRLELTKRDMSHLQAKTVELAQRAYGPMWDKVLDDEGTAALLGNAMVLALAENSNTLGLNSYGTGEWEMVWDRRKDIMKRADLVRDGEDFWGLIQNYEAYKVYCDTNGWYHPSGYRGPKSDIGELHRLYAAVTGAVYKPNIKIGADWFKGLNEPLAGFYKITKWTQEQSKSLVPLQALGVKATWDMVDDQGRIPANVLPFNEKTNNAFYSMLARGWSMTDPDAMADYKTKEEMRDGLTHNPAGFLAKVNGHVTDTQRREMESEPNPNRRVWRYLQQIDPNKGGSGIALTGSDQRRYAKTVNRQQQTALGDLFESPDYPQIAEVEAGVLDRAGYGLAAEVHRGKDLKGKYKAWENERRAFWLKEQEQIPANVIQALEQAITPEQLKESRRSTVKAWNRAYKDMERDPKRFFQENNVPFKAVTWVLNVAGSAMEAVGFHHLTDPATKPLGQFLMDHFLDPVPGDDVLVGQGQVPLDYVVQPPENRNLANWMGSKLTWGHVPQDQWEHMYARHLAGKKSLSDDWTVFAMAMRDFGADLPGAMYQDPIGMFVLGKTLGKYSKGVEKVAKYAKDKGIPRPMVAALQLASEPMHPVRALNVMFGVNNKVIDGLRTSVGEVKRVLNRAAKHAPELIATEKARISRLLDQVEERGLAPTEAVAQTRALHADVMAQLERGEKISFDRTEKLLEQQLTLPVDVARNILPPPLQLPAALREPARMLWEADQIVADLEKMDNIGAKALKEFSGLSYAEHVAQAWQAWYARPETFAAKRNAFMQVVAKMPGLAPETRQKIQSAYQKHVDWDRVLPAAAQNFRHALMAMKTVRGDFQAHARLNKAMSVHYRVDHMQARLDLEKIQDKQRRIQDREAYLSRPVNELVTQENFLREYIAHDTGITLTDRITPKTIGELRAATKRAKAHAAQELQVAQKRIQQTEFDMKKFAGASADMDYLMSQGFREFTSTKGIEEGYRSPLTQAERLNAVERHILPLLDAYGEMAKVEGVPARMVTMDRLVRRNAKLAGLNPLETRAARVRALQGDNVWNIKPIASEYQTMVQTQRELIKEWGNSQRTSDFRFRIWETAMADKFPNFKGAHLSEIVQGMTSDVNPLMSMAKRFRERYWHRLTDWDRNNLTRAQTEPGFAENQPLVSHFMSMFTDLEGFRQLVLEESVRVGRISVEDMQKYSSELYVERYYADAVFAPELTRLNYKLKGKPDTKLPVANRPKFNALKVQRSAQYARVFYRDRRTGKLVEHQEGVEANGSARAANTAAARWLQERIRSGEIEKHHAVQMGDKPGEYVVKVITDAEMGGMGLISDTGLFRIDRLQAILQDTLKHRVINHVAQMRGYLRKPVEKDGQMVPEGVEQAQWGEWTEPLIGREWGDLQGKMVHRSMIRQMNTLDRYGELLEAVRDQFVNEHAAVKAMTGLDKLMTTRIRNLKVPGARFVDGLFRSIYHNLIVKNWETWLTNHVGNWFSFGLMGLNPAETRNFSMGTEFLQMHRALAEIDVVKAGGRPGVWKAMEAKFGKEAVQGYRYLNERNMLAPTVGSEHIGSQANAGPGLRKALNFRRQINMDHERGISRKRAKLEEAQKVVALLDREISLAEQGKLRADSVVAPEKLEGVKLRRERMKAVEARLRKELYRDWVANPIWRQLTGEPLALAKELAAFHVQTDKSVAARALSEGYGKIDAMYKYIALRQLMRKGVPMAQAITRIENLMQNYNKVPSYVRALKNVPIFGAMVPSFAYEAGRIMKNAFTKYPGQALGMYSFPLIWNLSALGARGMTMDDFLMTDSSSNRAQAYMKMFDRLMLPTTDGMAQLYIGKYTFTNTLSNSAGMHRMWGREMQDKLDKAFGPGPAMIMSGAINFFSNFFGTTIGGNVLTTYTTGVDTFDRSVSFGAGAGETPAKHLSDTLASLLTPRTVTSIQEEVEASHEESQITGHRRTWFQSLMRTVGGASLSERKDSEVIGLKALQYSRMEQVVDVYKRMKSEDQVALKDAAVRARRAIDAGDEEKYRFERDEVKKIIAKGKDRLIYHSGKYIALETTPEEISEQVINYIGRDVLGVIQNVPIDRVPDFYNEMVLSGYRNASPTAMNHLYKQMGDWETVSGYTKPALLRKAGEKLSDLEGRFAEGDPELSQRYRTARQLVNLRLRQLEPRNLPAVQRVLQQVAVLEATLKDDPVAKRKALQRLLDAEDRMHTPK
jgi:hypothetical protein